MKMFHSHGHCQLTTVVFTRLLEGDECRLVPHRRDDRLHGAEHQLLRGPRVRLLQGADRLLGETVLVLCTARSPVTAGSHNHQDVAARSGRGTHAQRHDHLDEDVSFGWQAFHKRAHHILEADLRTNARQRCRGV